MRVLYYKQAFKANLRINHGSKRMNDDAAAVAAWLTESRRRRKSIREYAQEKVEARRLKVPIGVSLSLALSAPLFRSVYLCKFLCNCEIANIHWASRKIRIIVIGG